MKKKKKMANNWQQFNKYSKVNKESFTKRNCNKTPDKV